MKKILFSRQFYAIQLICSFIGLFLFSYFLYILIEKKDTYFSVASAIFILLSIFSFFNSVIYFRKSKSEKQV